ncbi:MAG: tetratricopeptide repeat protein [archaeon]|nr:tetratricopeptide repeat protein [archaeon]
MNFNDPMLEHLLDKITTALKENDREEASKYMDIIIEQYPDVANILLNSIEFSNIMAENEESAIEEAKALPIQDTFREDDEMMGMDEEQIIADMNSMLELEPENVEEFIQKGTVLTITESYEEAIECFDKALELNPNNISALISKGHTYEIIEDMEKAREIYEIVMNTEVDDIYDLMSKGYIFETHDRYEDALKTYEKALEKDKKNCNILFLKGSCLIPLEKYLDAIESLEEAINLYETQAMNTIFELPSAYHNIGICMDKLGKQDVALEAFNTGLRLNPEYFPSYYEIGLIQEDKKNYKEALKNYNTFLQFDQENEEVIKAKERVEKLL